MGSMHSIHKISFEDIIDTVLKNKHLYLLINTLPPTEQECLIINTLNAQTEESIMNQLISTSKTHHIIIYGRNANDPTIIRKYEQLTKFGFNNVYVYPGGLFEWLLLQETYGSDTFPTTSKCKDIYQYRAYKSLNTNLITNF